MSDIFEDNIFEEKYEKWREIHGKAFGKTFLSAFEDNHSAKVRLTSALILMTRRNFQKAKAMLETLEGDRTSDFDFFVLDYFMGLNAEFMGDIPTMTHHYEKVKAYEGEKHFSVLFHPYFRTAKFAQRESECKKALYYYKKALEFYSDSTPKGQDSETVGALIFETATVYLYSHNYKEAEKYVLFSEKFKGRDIPNREFLKSVLYALMGKDKEAYSLLKTLPPVLEKNGKITIDSILTKRNPHYFEVSQPRFSFVSFIDFLRKNAETIKFASINGSDTDKTKTEAKISKMLTLTFPFAKRKIECKIESIDGFISVLCKNYCIKTLETEQKALFDIVETQGLGIRFVSVNYFELEY